MWRFRRPVARSKNDYATHLPVLVGLAKATTIRSVLELGTGQYSTTTFLNRRIFSDLEILHSYENDVSWANSMRRVTEADSRATLNVVNGSIAAAMSGLDITDYDLVFVDDSLSADERVKTINTLRDSQPEISIIVIHDFEVPQYVQAAWAFRHRFAFKAYNPETGVVWQTGNKIADTLKRIDSIMKRNANSLEPDDVDGWLRVLS
jgi:predicted O-methyltransferase YrrM